ncbi:FtsX-like permease family protein [Streptomyces sp. NPDC026206]|uniref:ABC transporter permease n=1 Tax=Streptomyces sp. NPDC026206 TaxID=3157089 RepID=UPI0033DA263E
MITATLKSLLSRKLRLLLSGLAVVLGVMFVAGSMVMKDTLSRSFDAQFAGAHDDIDLQVSLKPKVDAEAGDAAAVPPAVDAAAVRRVTAVAGVDSARGVVEAEGARALGKDGKVVPGTGGPRYGKSWTGENKLIGLRDGRGPRAADEIAINVALAEKAGFKVGDRVGVLTGQPKKTFTVAGIFGYSDGRDSIGGEQTVAFTEPVAQELMMGKAGSFSGISVTTASDTSVATVQDALKQQLGADFQVETGEELSKKAADASRQTLDLMTKLLLGFAAVAVLVGIFLIINTFSIIIAQRLRELALLRAMGASRRQVIGSVLLESFVVGLIASVIGLAAGVGIGALGADMLAGNTDGLKVASLGLPTGAVVTSFTVGVGVTMLAALSPAMKASRVAPIAVIRASGTPDHGHRKQTVTGAVLLGLGLVLLALGLFGSGDNALTTILGGVLFTFIGVALLTPLFSGPAVWALGGIFSRSLPGQLGRRNSARNPRRTAITASALMIGIALVTAISTIVSSAKDSMSDDVSSQLKAELVALGDGGTSAAIEPKALDRARELPGMAAVSAAAFDSAKIGKETQSVSSWQDWGTTRKMMSLRAESGDIDTVPQGAVLMNKGTAKDRGLSVGDELTVQLQRGEARTYRLAGVFEDMPLVNNIVLPWADAQGGFRAQQPSQAYFQLKSGTSADSVRPELEKALADSPEVTVQSRDEVVDKYNSGMDMMLGIVQALLAVALIIAVLGIVNTLALSVLERTKELGALRAIGLSRGQTVRMIMTESVVISLFGALLGLVVGAGLGMAIVRAMKDQGVSGLTLPWSMMLNYLIGAVVVGMLASIIPARRGARLNVLKAVSHE